MSTEYHHSLTHKYPTQTPNHIQARTNELVFSFQSGTISNEYYHRLNEELKMCIMYLYMYFYWAPGGNATPLHIDHHPWEGPSELGGGQPLILSCRSWPKGRGGGEEPLLRREGLRATTESTAPPPDSGEAEEEDGLWKMNFIKDIVKHFLEVNEDSTICTSGTCLITEAQQFHCKGD